MHDDEGRAMPQGISFSENPTCRIESEFIKCTAGSTQRQEARESCDTEKVSFRPVKIVATVWTTELQAYHILQSKDMIQTAEIQSKS